jgi:GNAT superfamily N-acetyltransferase
MPTLEGLQFRTYQPEDLEQVLTLERTAFANQDFYRKLVMNLGDLHDIPSYYFAQGGTFLVGVYDEEVVAMGGARIYTGTASIGRMRTKRELQGKGFGLGKQVLTLLELWAMQNGCTNAILSTSIDEEQLPARILYESSGYSVTHYEPWKVLEKYYRKNLMYSVDAFDPSVHDSAEIAALHLEVRQQQVASGQNTFTDIMDSQQDLNDIAGSYINSGGNFFIAKKSATGATAGFVGIKNNGDGEGILKRLAVLPEHRNQWLGSSLVSMAVHWAGRNGLKHLTLSTGQNEPARPIYLRTGFEDYGFDGKNHLMELHLTA